MGSRGLGKTALTAVMVAVIGMSALVGVGTLAGCGNKKGGASAGKLGLPASGPINVTDDAGKPVSLASPAARIVSTAPADTEIAFALGAGGKVVAGTSYDDYPEEAKALPKIGDFQNPSVEKIISFEPDLVLATSGIQAKLRDRLEQLGAQVYVVDPVTLEAMYADLTNLGALMGVADQAKALVDGLKAREADVETKIAAAATAAPEAPPEPPDVFIEIWGEPLMTVGRETIIDDLITRAGGANVGAGAGKGFPQFSTEVLVERDPEVYIAVKGSQADPGAIARRDGYGSLTAVRDGHVYVIEDNILVRPGPRLLDGLEELARMIHPEAFAAQ